MALSATPVSKIENLQTIVQNLRVVRFEVRDEEDQEVKQYTYDRNIVEVIVDKENNIKVMEDHIFGLMELPLKFLKQAGLISPQTHPKFVNQMTILNMQDEFRAKVANGGYGPDMLGTVFTRTSVLLSLIHAKKLLLIHGY